MDSDDDFEDLLGEAELLHDAYTVSLTGAAANLSFAENANNQYQYTALQTDISHSYQDNLFSTSPSSNTNAVQLSTKHSSDSDHRDDTPPPPPALGPNTAIIKQIERVFEEIVDALLNEKREVSIKLKNRTSQCKPKTGQDDSTGPMRRVCFPGKTADEAWRFAVVTRLLELMHEALRNDTMLSKRDLYYRDPALFAHQTHVDRYVDEIALTFGVTRSALNVIAVAKGLVAGAIIFCRRDGGVVNAAIEPEGLLVPNLKEMLSVDMTAVKWILVVEKEATFRSITASKFWGPISTRGVILTGKGYPDLSSRALLRFLSTPSAQNGFASPPVFGLADFDPHGIAILGTYKHGSKALDHETESHQVPQLQRLGICSRDLQIAVKDTRAAQGLMSLSTRDRKKAVKMLEQSASFATDDVQLLQVELQVMLMLNMKAELQLFDALQHGMVDFLNSRLSEL